MCGIAIRTYTSATQLGLMDRRNYGTKINSYRGQKQRTMNDWILLEDPSLYDGWIAKVNTETKEIQWREDHYVVKRLSNEFKENWEHWFRNANPEYRITEIRRKRAGTPGSGPQQGSHLSVRKHKDK